jgi:hypothetical protein
MGGGGVVSEIGGMEDRLSRRIREGLRGMKVAELLLLLFFRAEDRDSGVGGI